MKLGLIMAVSGVALQAVSSEWYVSSSAATGGDGSREAPFQTIQAAVDAAAEDDIVKVMPGVYDTGSTNDGYMASRVWLTKRLTLEATGTKDETHIVGVRSTASGGYGSDAVRCIYAGQTGSTIKGFTIRDGGVLSTDDSPAGSGGGVCGYAGVKSSVWVVDCTISNCVAVRGGAVRAATVFRSLIAGNSRVGVGNGAAGRDAAFYNCIVTGNMPLNQPLLHNCNVVNCTVFGNASGSLWSGAYVRNSLFFMNAGTDAGVSDVHNTVIDNFSTAVPDTATWMDNITNASPYQVLSPAFEDVRPVAGSVAATAGAAEQMSIYGATVKTDYLYTDFLGNPIPTQGAICAGAVQETVSAPVSGGIALGSAGGFSVYGAPTQVAGLWAHPESYPIQMHIPKSKVTGAHVFTYWVDSDTQANWRAPEMDDSFYVMPMVTPGTFLNVGVRIASADWVRYVSRNGSDANDGKTPATAYLTLQKAATSLNGSYVNCVVYCGEGIYGDADGSTVAGNHNTRLAVTTASKIYIRFKGAGRGLSVIEGKPDPGTGGRGAEACRGVFFASPCILQGFTVRNGYAANGSDDTGNGGAGIFATANAQIADCRFENCVGDKGAIGFYGAYMRCEFTGGYANTACFRGARFFTACSFFHNWGGTQGVIYGGEGKLYNCTMWAGIYDGTYSRNYGGGTYLYNSILMKHMESSSGGHLSGCIVNDTGYFVTASGFTRVDPGCVSVADGDFRIFYDSPAFGAGDALPNDWRLYYASGDLNGRSFRFDASGNTCVGCIQWPVSRVTVTSPSSGAIEPSGAVALGESGSVSFSYTPGTPARHFLGFSVNGGEPSDASTVCTLDGADFAEAGAISVAAVFSTNWYVNAAKADDSGDGFTPETAKKTLRAVMEDTAVTAGDCVHAAPGNYNTGLMPTPGFDGTTSNRVVLAEGVALVADEGPAVTTITGQASPSPHNGDSYGRGPFAARCVYMANNSRLVGFTVTGGRTDISQTGDNLYSSGGGIYVSNAAENIVGTVVNCTIQNNYGYRGGGSYAGKFVNCRFAGNLGYGAQGEDCRIAYCYGCVFEANATKRNVYAANAIEQCTFGPNTSVYGTSNKTLKGCLFLMQDLGSNSLTLDHCAYVDSGDIAAKVAAGTFTDSGCVKVQAAADFLLDGYVPTTGSPLIDAGPAATTAGACGGVDNRMSQRIYNGCIDIGANEYDWRPVYAQRLGCARAAVAHASPDVTDGGSFIRVPGGSSVVVAWDAIPSGKAKCMAQTVGDGSLSILLGEDVLRTLTAADGLATVRFASDGHVRQAFSFSGTGEARICRLGLAGGIELRFR